MGEPGRIYSEVAASWLGMLSLVGLWLWFKRRKSLHSKLGVWLLPGFIFLTITGLTWSSMAGGNIANLRAELDWEQPSLSAQHEHHGHGQHSNHSSHHSEHSEDMVEPARHSQIDTALAVSRDAGMSGVIEMTLPKVADGIWHVTEMREPWKMENDAVAVDGLTGEVVDRIDHDDWPLAAKLSAWLIQLHMGTLFGWINQVALAVVALGLLTVIFLGYRSWWRKRRLTAAGQWRKTNPKVLLAIIVFLCAYSLIAPMFGISLVAFLIVDVIIQALRRNK